jgi:hypothetical protein
MATTAEIVDHIRQRVAEAKLELDPFPYFVTTKLLPDPVYDEILANWPPEELLKSTNWATRKELHVARKLDLFPESIRDTWRRVDEWAQVARDLVFQKLQPYLADKFIPMLGRARAKEIKLATQRGPAAFLATYTGALSLATHVDHPFITTNSFIYVSERDVEEPEMGTILYQSYGLAFPHNEAKLPDKVMDRFLRKAKTVPYQRNTMLSYVNGPFSFHGVDPIDIGSRIRRLLMFGTVLDPQKTFNADEVKRLSGRL